MWFLLFGIGVVCLVIGIYEGQLEDVYRKAVMICLECIGIG
ncbi:MAG: thioredoxin [Lachnospiraceae bacterium]|nr:thioredoxin [Lachnospiraceae bacterium]